MITINNWPELVTALTGLQGKCLWAARGERAVFPSVMSPIDRVRRKGALSPIAPRLGVESVAITRFVQMAPAHASFVEQRLLDADFLSQSAVAQHYGVPTRLVDWSHSLWVAAYLACECADDPKSESDGRIMYFDFQMLSDAAAAFARASRMRLHLVGRVATGSPLVRLIDRATEPGSQVPEEECLLVTEAWQSYVRNSRGEIVPLLLEPREALHIPPFVLPSILAAVKFPRLIAQQGVFTFATRPWVDHWEYVNAMLRKHTSPRAESGEIIIARDAKREILERLAQMGITGGSMFPGMDGVGRSVREYVLSVEHDAGIAGIWRRQEPIGIRMEVRKQKSGDGESEFDVTVTDPPETIPIPLPLELR